MFLVRIIFSYQPVKNVGDRFGREMFVEYVYERLRGTLGLRNYADYAEIIGPALDYRTLKKKYISAIFITLYWCAIYEYFIYVVYWYAIYVYFIYVVYCCTIYVV